MNALVLLISGLLFLMSLALFVWTKKQLRIFQDTYQSTIQNNSVNSELTALNAGSIGLGERYNKLDKKLQILTARMDEVSNEVISSSPYAYAIELAQRSTSAENIAELSHISLTEAELLLTMHQEEKAA